MKFRRSLLVAATLVTLVPVLTIRAAGASPASTPSAESWTLHKGDTVKQDISAWASSAGWRLIWVSGYDLPIAATVTYTGDFVNAVDAAIDSVGSTDINLLAYDLDNFQNRVVAINMVPSGLLEPHKMNETITGCINGASSSLTNIK